MYKKKYDIQVGAAQYTVFGVYEGGVTFSRFSFIRKQIPVTEDTEENKIALFEREIFDWGKSYFKRVTGEGYLTTLKTGETYFPFSPTSSIFNAISGSTVETPDYFFRNGFYAGWDGKGSYLNQYNGLYTQYPDGKQESLMNNFGNDFVGQDYDSSTKDAAVDGIIYNMYRIGKQEILDKYIKEDTGAVKTVSIKNPLKDAKINDAVKITSVVPHYYLRLGFLLEYIKNNVIPKIVSSNSRNPMIDLQYNDDDIMFSIEDQISLDPRICIVRNDDFLLGDKIYQQACLPFRVTDDLASLGSTKVDKDFAGYVMNIYLNFDFIIESLAEDERGDVNLFDFLKNICTGINKALGGINNLEPVLDEDTNTVRIIDTTPIPGTVRDNNPKPEETIILTGYKGTSTNYISNFVRKVNLKTAITPEFATMITVGATAGGYVKGTDATAFSKWNKGLVDLYKEEVEPGNEETALNSKSGSIDEAITNWEKKIVNALKDERLGFSDVTDDEGDLLGRDLKDSIIQGNVSIGTEYYKYYVAKESNTAGGTAGGGSIGFIPFKLSFTMDGLSGIKIYNKLNVDTSFLPKTYGNNLDLIVTGVSHRLQNQDWETSIETTVIPKSKPTKSTKRFTGGVVSSGTPTPPSTGGGGTGPKTLGTHGTVGPTGLVSPLALPITEIDKIVTSSNTSNELRKRIVRIAASYVGQTELPGKNVGFYDLKFKARVQNQPTSGKWYVGQMWCNVFTNLCWYEAYKIGNALVPPNTDINTINKYKTILGDGKLSKPLTKLVFGTYNNAKALGLTIDISQAKNGTKLPQPGDMVVYTYSHIAIVVGVVLKDGKLDSISTIGGNESASDQRDGGGTEYTKVRRSGIKGFIVAPT